MQYIYFNWVNFPQHNSNHFFARLLDTYIEDITCPRVDMNFFFELSTQKLTSERSERVRYREDKIHIHKRACYILFII